MIQAIAIRKAGATSNIFEVFVADSSVTTGAGKTGLAFNTSSIRAYYKRDVGTAPVAISLVTMTLGTFTSGGFKEVDATNMPGMYEFCPPDAAFAAGAKEVIFQLGGASGMQETLIKCRLTSVDLDDGVHAGITGIPNAAAGAVGGLPLSVDTSGRVDVLKINGTTQTARDIGASVISDSVTNPVTVGTNNDKTGYGLSAAAVQAVWDALTSALTTAGSIGKLIVTNLDALISSRLATSGYTAPDNTSITAIKAKTDNLPAAPAAVSNIPTANQNADALLDRADAIETGWTVRMIFRIVGAALGGKASGLATTTAIFRNVTDSKNRITATVDSSGNRSAVTLDGT